MEYLALELLLLAALLFLGFYFGGAWLRNRRRRRIAAAPLPLEWEEILNSNVALYELAPDELKPRLRGLVSVFLAEKSFEGCGGLEMSDEIRVTIAGAACLLTLNKKSGFYPNLQTVLVYPDSYFTTKPTPSGDLGLHEECVLDGESWDRGEIILSWAQVARENSLANSQFNIVIHEFAHQLDHEFGVSSSIFSDLKSFATSANIVLSSEFNSFREDVGRGFHDVIDDYGAESPAEFFAVASEAFFGKSAQMNASHPALYDELRKFYGLDPLEWRMIRQGAPPTKGPFFEQTP